MPTDKYFMDMALHIATASKCIRAQYGTVITNSGIIVATGYNGKPAGSCNDNICYRVGLPDNARGFVEADGKVKQAANCCLHSEANAILFAGRAGCLGSTLYVSGTPCTDCALLIAQAGIARLVFLKQEYDEEGNNHRGNFDIDFHIKYGMKFIVDEYTPSRINRLYYGLSRDKL